MTCKVHIAYSRFLLIFLGISMAFCAVLGRLTYLHLFKHRELTEIAQSHRKQVTVLNPRRGNIRDLNGNLLASTRSVVELGVDPEIADPIDPEKLRQLSDLLNLPEEEIREKSRRTVVRVKDGWNKEVRMVRWRKLREGLSDELYQQIRDIGIPGIYGNRVFERYYPGNQLAAHLVGFLNKETTPVMGVELYLDYYLKGQKGIRETERDGRKRELVQFRQFEIAPRDGWDVELTIDTVIQDIVEKQVYQTAENYDPDFITIIVSHARTGQLLALSNWPTFDPNHFWDFPVDNMRNRSVTDIYEPGSTFKIVAIGGALNDGLVNPETLFDCNRNEAWYSGRLVSLPRDHKALGTIPVSKIVSQSSNRGAAQLGMRLGGDRLYEYCRSFGFGEKSGFELGAEVTGMLHQVKDWDGLTISRLPMGHAIGATPMQVHYAMSAVANQGILMAPTVIKRILDENGNTVVNYEPVVRRRVLSDETSILLAHLLVATVAPGGTAPDGQIPGYEVAGKTGTTQKIINGQYSHSHHTATFSGFFPASDPELVITVVVDDPELSGVAYAGKVAAPIFKDIAIQIIQYLGMEPLDDPFRKQKSDLWKGDAFANAF